MSAVAILKLERSGFTARQVEALSEYLDGQVASTVDLEAKIETESATVRGDLKAESARPEGKIEAGSAAVQGESRLIKWMLALVIVTTTIPLIRDFTDTLPWAECPAPVRPPITGTGHG